MLQLPGQKAFCFVAGQWRRVSLQKSRSPTRKEMKSTGGRWARFGVRAAVWPPGVRAKTDSAVPQARQGADVSVCVQGGGGGGMCVWICVCVCVIMA